MSPVSTRSTATRSASVRRRHRRARDQRPLGQPPRPKRPARRRHRGRRPPGRHPWPRDRGRRVRRHRLLLRRARRRQLSDQHAHDAAQQPDAEIRCDTGPSAGAALARTSSPRASRPARPTTSPTPSASTRCRRRSNWPAGRRRAASRSRSPNEAGAMTGAGCRKRSPQTARLGRLGGRPHHHRARRNSRGPATTTSDSTPSTAISTTPTSRCCCAGWSTFRSPPRCGCPRPTPRRSAGCSTPAPTPSSSRWSNPPNRPPRPWPRRDTHPRVCAASGRCGRVSATTRRPGISGERVRDGRDRARARRARRDLRGARAFGHLRRARRPGDLDGPSARSRHRRTRWCWMRWPHPRHSVRGRTGHRNPRRRRRDRTCHGADWVFG